MHKKDQYTMGCAKCMGGLSECSMRHCLKQCLFESTKDLSSCLDCSNKFCRTAFTKCAQLPGALVNEWMTAFDTNPAEAVTPNGESMLEAAKLDQRKAQERSAKSSLQTTEQHIKLEKDKLKELDDDNKIVSIASAEGAEAKAKQGMKKEEEDSMRKLQQQEKSLKASKESDAKAENRRLEKKAKDQDSRNEKGVKVPSVFFFFFRNRRDTRQRTTLFVTRALSDSCCATDGRQTRRDYHQKAGHGPTDGQH